MAPQDDVYEAGRAPKPTDAELAILRVLWNRGESTVREVHQQLSKSRSTGYTTVLKTMQIMVDKGLLERDASNRSHVFRANFSEQRIQDQLVGDLVSKAFDGSVAKLAMRALSDRPASAEELEEIRALLNRLENDASAQGESS